MLNQGYKNYFITDKSENKTEEFKDSLYLHKDIGYFQHFFIIACFLYFYYYYYYYLVD